MAAQRPAVYACANIGAAATRPSTDNPASPTGAQRALLAAGPFRYIEAPGDGSEALDLLDQSGRCRVRVPLDQWRIWLCNGAERAPIASFTDGIVLEAAQIPDRLPADGYLPVTLFWSAQRPLERDYTVFVHVVGPDGQMMGQWDQVPAAGKSPTSRWEPGRLVADEYRFPVKAAPGGGPVRVYVGMYDPTTGTRLDAASADPVSERRLLVQTMQSR